MWSIKVYLILIKAITVVELASRPCLDLAFTLPNPLLDLAIVFRLGWGFDNWKPSSRHCSLKSDWSFACFVGKLGLGCSLTDYNAPVEKVIGCFLIELHITLDTNFI